MDYNDASKSSPLRARICFGATLVMVFFAAAVGFAYASGDAAEDEAAAGSQLFPHVHSKRLQLVGDSGEEVAALLLHRLGDADVPVFMAGADQELPRILLHTMGEVRSRIDTNHWGHGRIVTGMDKQDQAGLHLHLEGEGLLTLQNEPEVLFRSGADYWAWFGVGGRGPEFYCEATHPSYHFLFDFNEDGIPKLIAVEE
jgi:hypothetical protein